MMLTLFTPAYNREATLPRLYESLLRQTCFDFEWLIIDDGSSDDTSRLVHNFTGEGKFPVRYVYKENGGKHTAHNLALEEAEGEWFLCVDSDDTLAPGAVEMVLKTAREQSGINGIISYKTDLLGNRLSDPFPEGVKRAKLYELDTVYGCTGEFALAFPTAFAKRYPFPVFPGERFIGECVVYDRMDLEGEMYLLDGVTMPCEYQPEGYSQGFTRLMKNNPSGFCLFFLQRIDLMPTLKKQAVMAGKYWCLRWICGNRTLQYKGKHRVLVSLSMPLGVLFRIYYRFVRGF